MNVFFKYLTAIVIVLIALSNSSDPPNGRTGAPGDGVCSACHSGNNFEGNIAIDGLPSEVESGKSYTITVSVNNTDGNAVRAGFQMVSLFNGDFDNAGEYIKNTTDVGISVANDRKYIEHRGAKNFQNKVAQWIFDWEAPIVDEEKDIIMFAAGNIANGSGSSGDAIKFKEGTTTVRPSITELEVSIETVEILCNDDLGDLAAIASGGVEPYSFVWSNGQEDADNLNVPGGDYSVTVTDAVDSSVVVQVVLTEPAPFTYDLKVLDESSDGASDGSIQANVSGGTAPYTYEWSNGETTSEITGLIAGTYNLIVTDANACMDTSSFDVQLVSCAFQINLQVNQITCNGESDGEALIDPAGFEQPLTFEWSNGDNAFIAIAGLDAGEYAVSVTDGTGCTVVEAFVISEPDLLSVDINIEFQDCGMPEINSLIANVFGGTGTYTYLWSDNSTNQTISNVAEGNYSVTVTDGNGCTKEISDFEVSYEDEQAPKIRFTDSVSLFVDANGMLDLTPLNLSETDECGIQATELSGDLSCDNFDARTLTYSATDNSNNTAEVEIYVTAIIDTIAPTAICVADIIQDGCDTIFYEMPEFFDNCGIETIELAEGLPSGSIFPKDSTKVTYNVFDKAGNFFCCSFWVVTTNDIELVVDDVIDATSAAGGAINISVSGGSGSFTYEWTFNDTLVISSFEDVTNLAVGTYQVLVRDDSGCIIMSEVILIELGSAVSDLNLPDVTIFPNPVNNRLNIKHDGLLSKIQILDLNGKQASKKKGNGINKEVSLNVSNLKAGIYFIKLDFEEGSKTFRFIKI